MKTRAWSVSVVASCLVTAGGSIRGSAQGLEVADGGQSPYTIVRPADASPSQLYAAGELRDFIARMTGATCPIVTDAEPLPERAFLLGVTRHTEAVLGEAVDATPLGDDGFRLVTRAPHVLIVGGPVRGTLYGVYELLETYGGCRWYSSTFDVVPRHDTWAVPDVDWTEVPAFVMREPFWFDMFRGDFAARSRANGNRMELEEKHGGKIRFGAGLFVHTFYRLMPPDEFFADHPEYYSEIDGARRADHAQLCLTNPDVLRICTERLLGLIRSDPSGKLYSLSQNDWYGYCTCADCRAVDEREGSPSGTMIAFVNQVAEAVEKEFPNAWIETLAYQYTRHPPKTLRPRHNVVPRLCTIECDFSKPLDVSTYEQNRKFVEDIRGWSAITDKLYVWDYTTNFAHYLGPHPNFPCLQGNARFFRDNGVVGLFEQGAYQGRHAEFAELRAWVLAKLLWNPDRDLETLYEDFFTGYYGPAAETVRTYFDELQALAQPDEHPLRIFDSMQAGWLTDEFLDRAATLWRQAEDRTRGTRYEYTVRMGALPVLYARLARRHDGPVRYHWQDGRAVPTGMDPTYDRDAREFLARLAEGKDVRVAEHGPRHDAFLGAVTARTEGLESAVIRADGLAAALVREAGARVSMLAVGGVDLADPEAGGIDWVDEPGAYAGTDESPWDRAPTPGPGAVAVRKGVDGRYTLSRTLELADGAAILRQEFTSARATAQTIRPVFRAALNLGRADRLRLRLGDGPDTPAEVPADRKTAVFALKAGDAQQLTLTCPATGRSVRIEFAEAPEDIRIVCDTVRNGVRAFIAWPPRDLAPEGRSEAAVRLVPAIGTPDAAEPGPTPHRADTVVLEDFMLPLGPAGRWGEHVADPDARDGRAVRFFNNHYEWCMQWRVDPSLFEPGATYTVRMRIRVAKGGRGGEAFWAGVYDTGRKESFGQIAASTAEVGDAYQWYDVATWTPESGQYVWAGPGRFAKDEGETSAVEGVYVDCVELVRRP